MKVPTLFVNEAASQIRSVYAAGAKQAGFDIDALKHFDKWLELHDAEVTAQAETRIVELLEKHTHNCIACCVNDYDLIALIKGEN